MKGERGKGKTEKEWCRKQFSCLPDCNPELLTSLWWVSMEMGENKERQHKVRNAYETGEEEFQAEASGVQSHATQSTSKLKQDFFFFF